ncbi:hypothetical protein C8J57DRAFT_1290686 [Mycena rebaudengoi]|nr:hypothetical protein C8J57DRAFT_1290686 [Mycena rebaudengoi]
MAALPVDGLPVELLAEILLWSLVVSTTHRTYKPTDILRLSQVSRHWRLVAHSTPQLWTCLSIDLNLFPGDTYIAALKTWFNRSVPLTLSLTLLTYYPQDDERVAAIVAALVPFRNRFASLTFWVHSFAPFLPLFAKSLDSLEALHLNEYATIDPHDGPVIELAAVAPCLRRASLYRDDYVKIFEIPWALLTHLRLCDWPGDTLEILRQCRNLETVDIVALEGDLILPNNPVTLNRLHSLTLIMETGETPYECQFPCFFRPLVLPALVSLKIDCDGIEWPPTGWSADDFTQFQLRTPSLQFLSLSCAINSRELIAMLRSSPTLRSLHLVCLRCVDDTFLQALRYRESDSQGPLVPLLDTLSCDIRTNFTEALLEDMLRSRWWPSTSGSAPSRKVSRLKSVYIYSSQFYPLTKRFSTPAVSDGFRVRMQDCLEDGMVFR